MKRRAFLQTLLNGGAVLTSVQATALQRKVASMPAETSDYSGTWDLRWLEPVADKRQLPKTAQEGDAIFVKGTLDSYVFVGEGVGWCKLKLGGFR